MTNHDFSVVSVTMEDREDGGLFVYSEDLPGLILSGPDKDAICNCIAPAIEAIFRHKGYSYVSVHEFQTDAVPVRLSP